MLLHNFFCVHRTTYECAVILVCVKLHVNGSVHWVNRSVHAYKGHECVFIIKCVCVSVYVCRAETQSLKAPSTKTENM